MSPTEIEARAELGGNAFSPRPTLINWPGFFVEVQGIVAVLGPVQAGIRGVSGGGAAGRPIGARRRTSIAQAWGRQGDGACAAPADYRGICRRWRRRVPRFPRSTHSAARSRSFDFSNRTASQKASWAAMCDAAWLGVALAANPRRASMREVMFRRPCA